MNHIWNEAGDCTVCGVEECRTGNSPCSGAKKAPLSRARAETGPMQFRDDWPGVFIRGDNAFAMAMALEQALLGGNQIANAQARSIIGTLRSCIVSTERPVVESQQALLLE